MQRSVEESNGARCWNGLPLKPVVSGFLSKTAALHPALQVAAKLKGLLFGQQQQPEKSMLPRKPWKPQPQPKTQIAATREWNADLRGLAHPSVI